MTRAEHLAWCKQRALEYVEAGDVPNAVSSMLSDLRKHSEPLYDQSTFHVLATDGLMFRKTPDDVRNWINGFN